MSPAKGKPSKSSCTAPNILPAILTIFGFLSTDFHKSLRYQIWRKFQWELRYTCRQTGRRTNGHDEVNRSYSRSANAPKKGIIVLRGVTWCILAARFQRFEETCCLFLQVRTQLCLEDRAFFTMFINKYLPEYTVSHPSNIKVTCN